MDVKEITGILEKAGSRKNVEGMERFAITGSPCFGCGVPFTRRLAGRIKKEGKGRGVEGEKEKNSEKLNLLARNLWDTGYHECRLLAVYIADVKIGWKEAEKWVRSSRNWAEIDQLSGNLLWKFGGVKEKALKMCEEKRENGLGGDGKRKAGWGEENNPALWAKRTGFVLMAVLAVREKDKLDGKFVKKCLEKIEKHSKDERNFIRKAVNWALRQIGKSTNGKYYPDALELARKLAGSKGRTARWIGADAKRELEKLGEGRKQRSEFINRL